MNSRTNLLKSIANPRNWFPAIFVERPFGFLTVQHTFEYKLGLAANQKGIDYDGVERLVDRIFEENGYYPVYRFFFPSRLEDGVKNTYLVVCTKEGDVLNEITAGKNPPIKRFHTIDGEYQRKLHAEIKGHGHEYLIEGEHIIESKRGSLYDPALFAEYKDPQIVDEATLANPSNFDFLEEGWVRNNIPYKEK